MPKVNDPNWEPRLIFEAPRRWFQRKDGHVFAQPSTEEWHIQRMLQDGWVEVAGPQGNTPAAPAAPDAKDEEIARLKALLAEKEAEHGVQANYAPDNRSGAGANRRPGQR